jgi:CubicO group peptidase (beta-lactamase class C family)
MKYGIWSRILILLLCLLLVAPVLAKPESPIDQARSLVKEFMNTTMTPGITVSVGVKNRIVWSEGFGYADLEQKVPVRPGLTKFRIGSVSKPLTATAMAQLYEQGKLDLDAPVQKYVPSFPKKPQGTITTRLLAGHLAGIRHYEGNEFYSQKHYTTVLEGLNILKDDPLLFTPGTEYSYSSYGWNLISAVIEGASGQDFLSYMQARVFQPAGMQNTMADQVSQIIENRTRFYIWEDSRIVNAPSVDNSYKWAGGGFLSTSEDLVRFGFAHLNAKVVKPETIKLLWTSQKLPNGQATGYGMGWQISYDSNGKIRWVGHAGSSVGGSTIFGIYPEQQVVVAIITNMSDIYYGNLPYKIGEVFITANQK